MLFIGYILIAIGTFFGYMSQAIEMGKVMNGKLIVQNALVGLAWPVAIPAVIVYKLIR